MRFLGSLLAAGLSTVAVATASSLPPREVSSVYYKHSSNSPSQVTDAPTLSLSQFTLALAHRLGLSQFYSINEQDDVDAITKIESIVPGAEFLGGNGKGKLVVHITGVDREFFSDIKPTFNVASSSVRIDQSFFTQAEMVMGAELGAEHVSEEDHKDRIEILSHSYRYTSQDSSTWDSQEDEDLIGLVKGNVVSKFHHHNPHHQNFITGFTSLQNILLNGIKNAVDHGEYAFIHIPLLKWLEPNSEAYAAGVQLLSAYFHTLLTTHTHESIADLTLIISPSFLQPSYIPTDSHATIINSELKKRKEIPISISSPPHSNAPNTPPPSPLAKSGETSPNNNAILHPPRRFKTKEDCETQTNLCSSHGECNLSDFPIRSSWACRCHSTKIDLPGGNGFVKKYWAGNACQKEDISAQFHVILIFTILLISGIAAAIMAMMSMGSQELPGVLTAAMPAKKQ